MTFTHRDYTVAWICALPLELAATKSVLDEVHPSLPSGNSDHNNYTLGSISGHNVAVACLPHGVYGKVSASTVVSQMLSTFPEIQFGLMVGIGGGVPSDKADIRLGDVVISKPTGTSGGVIQYDFGKTLRYGQFQRTGSLDKPHPVLLTALSQMDSNNILGSTQVKTILNVVQTKQESGQQYTRPSEDLLFQSTYDHPDGIQDCSTCNQNQLVNRAPRETEAPFLHYGLIASGDQVMKNAKMRDSIAQELNVLCFEMEAAGLMDQLRPLVIRGICDYCDSHKNKKWQGYAALAAAAYARVLLSEIPAFPMVNADIKLREYYGKNNRLGIKRLSGDLLDMEQCYINLSIVEYQHNKLEKKQPSSTFSLLDRLKVTAATPEREVTLTKLFDDRKQPDDRMAQPRRILIRGRAGVGKTTLCKKIVHDFLHKQMWAKLFDRIIWIPLRRLKGVSRLDEFFRQEYFSFQAERDNLVSALWKMAFDQPHKRTLWLLDGLDEVSGYRNPSGTDLTELFNGLLNQDNAIITSRPYAVDLSSLAPFDLELETVGFHNSQVQTYLAKTMHDQDMADQIRVFIQSHWLVQGLVRIPIQLDALCYSWDNDFCSNGLQQTMTAIYQAIELKLWKKDILQLEKRSNSVLLSESVVQKLRTRLQIKAHVGTEMKLLECLAFTGLHNDIIEFHQGHRDRIYEQPEFCEMSDDILDRLSFLRTSDASSRDKSYHFLHLTFQEFFAAQYFVRCWTSTSEQLICLKLGSSKPKNTTQISPEEFLQQEKYSRRYDVFWRFVTGLLHDYDEERLCSFFEKIGRQPRDLLGPAHQRLLMHCFSEIPLLEPLEGNNASLQRLREKMELGCIQWSRYEHESLKTMHLCRETEFPEHVVSKLLEEEFTQGISSWRVHILRALTHRRNMSLNLLRMIADYMDDGDPHVRKAAIYALGEQSPLSQEILNAVVPRLDDSNSDVRQAAVEVLCKQQLSLPQEILDAVVSRLDNSNWPVRRAAIRILGKQQLPLPQEILDAVVSRLDDRDWPVRQAAIYALGEQSLLSQEILNAVVPRLDDSNSDVRQAAVEVLGKQQLPLPQEILDAVVSRLDDSNSDVRWAAIYTLGEQSLLSQEILNAVVPRLDDSNSDVRQAAVEVLCKQQLPLPQEILDAVVSRLDDSNSAIRQAAVEILGKQQLPLPQEILDAVVSRLDDSEWLVRQAAIYALGEQSPLSQEILNTMVYRLDDSNSDVRQAAVEVLGKQSPLPPEILDAVVSQLKHLPSSVAPKVEAVLWKHDEYLSVLPNLDAEVVSALCKIWITRSIREIFACYVYDGITYFETPDGRRSIPLCMEQVDLLKCTFQATTVDTTNFEYNLE